MCKVTDLGRLLASCHLYCICYYVLPIAKQKIYNCREASVSEWVKQRPYKGVHHSRYKYLSHVWQLVRWATSHLGHAFTHVFESTDQSIYEKNVGAVTARACSACTGLCSSHKWCLEFARAYKGLVWLSKPSHLTT